MASPEYRNVVRPIMVAIDRYKYGKAINIHGSVFSERGTPDIIAVIDSNMICIECKKSKQDKPTKIQIRRMREWQYAGAYVYCVASLEELKANLKTDLSIDLV